jgi:hypothetical protein
VTGEQWNPKPIGHAVSADGDHLTLYPGLPGSAVPVAFDDDGCGPYHRISGCPNCGKFAGEWWDPFRYVGSLNAGRDPNEPCSRVCRFQLEWQAEVAARRLTGGTAA